MSPVIADEDVLAAKAMVWQLQNWGVEMRGRFGGVTKEAWDDACDRMVKVKSVMLDHGVISDAKMRDAGWIVPLLCLMGVDQMLFSLPIIDVGCGPSTFVWDAYLRGIKPIVGIDMWVTPTLFPPSPTIQRVKSQVLDLGELRAGLDSVVFPPGGLMICTEMVEHLSYNPLASFVMIVERLKPRFLYITAPTPLNNDNAMSWRHYSDLPTYRGQRVRMSSWHVKGWTIDELGELVYDLGFSDDDCFGGLSRVGWIGERRK